MRFGEWWSWVSPEERSVEVSLRLNSSWCVCCCGLTKLLCLTEGLCEAVGVFLASCRSCRALVWSLPHVLTKPAQTGNPQIPAAVWRSVSARWLHCEEIYLSNMIQENPGFRHVPTHATSNGVCRTKTRGGKTRLWREEFQEFLKIVSLYLQVCSPCHWLWHSS